jgi:hypothetical protein
MGLHLLPDDGAGVFQDDWRFDTASAISDPAGHFTFLGVPAGQYVLEVLTVSNGGSRPSMFARLSVTVGDTAVRDLALVMAEGGRLRGRIQFSGSKERPSAETMQGVQITLVPVGWRLKHQVRAARPDVDGSFEIGAYPPGRYLVAVSAPSGWNLESVAVNGKNAADEAVDLDASAISNVLVALGSGEASVTGRIDGSPDTVSGMAVVAFPAEVEAWIAGGLSSRRVRVAFSDEHGSVLLRLPSGNYFVAAVTGPVPDLHDPNEVRSLAGRATRVLLVHGQTQSVTLRPVAGPGGS